MYVFGDWHGFAEPIGVAHYASYTLTDALQALYDRAGGVGAYWQMNDASFPTFGRVSDNAMYTTAPGAELHTGPNAASDSAGEANATTGWSGVGVTVASQTGEVHDGTYAISLTSSDGESDRGEVDLTLTLGKTYTISAWARAVQTNISAAMNLWVNVHNTPTNDFVTGTWAQKSYQQICTSAAVKMRFYAPNVAAEVTYIDNLTVKLTGDLDLGVSTAGITANAAGPNGLAAYDLNGSTGTLTLYAQTSINGLDDMTWVLRIVPDVVGTDDTLIFKSGELDVYFNASGQLVAHVDYDTTDAESITTSAITTADTHIVITHSASDNTVRIYLNGVEAAYGTQTAGVGTRVSNTNNILLANDGSGNGLDGRILRCALFATVATAGEVAAMYAARNQDVNFT